MSYSHILLALNLSDVSTVVADRAVALAKQNDARLSLIHVIEPLSFAQAGEAPMNLSDLQDQLDKCARERMKTFSEQLDVQTSHQFVITGYTKTEVHRIAKQEGVDLVVVGSHGRHGMGLLLGSTANGILHGATCDVLAVRVPKTD
jgi:universal stress protein A